MAQSGQYRQRASDGSWCMVIKFKPIKPGQFKSAAFEQELRRAVQDVGRDMRKNFERPVSTWNHRPSFRMMNITGGSRIGVEVFTENDIFSWVSQGTNGPGGSWYPIRPRGNNLLHYQAYYRRKTVPGSLASSSGGKYGSWLVRSRVRHPGIRSPRRFDETVAHLALPVLEAGVAKAMDSGRSKSGHAI
jgi:hypothetical protein